MLEPMLVMMHDPFWEVFKPFEACVDITDNPFIF